MAAGTLAGGLIYFAPSKSAVSLQAQVESAIAPVAEQIKEALEPAKEVAVQATDFVQEWVTGVPSQQPGAPMVLLNEPVVIIGEGQEALPKGTPVRVIKHQGPYVQVQHQSRIITIPRTAMVLGAYRSN